ncbi:3'-5' exonuclease [Telluria beijingensis]|uniref:3'-5' exonuclease n=1 Tax=Telluria beijingensis TaxID=3068633 RepID=UPI0027955EF9|nr:3'-5' exonuclease [Massilia sp. REN29]
MTMTTSTLPVAAEAPQRRADDKRPTASLDWRGAEPGLARMSDAMIDTETLGTTPGSAILSLGAVMFGPDGLGETFYAPIDLASCVLAGLAIDPATVQWWMAQGDEARAAAFPTDAATLPQVLLAFQAWFVAQEARYPWCHGAGFDVPLLDAAFKACGLASPWAFWDVRDTRTLYDVAGVKVDRRAGTHHHALDDAISQAEAAARALRIVHAHKTITEVTP